jgi:NhaA family Na+:H+ antiporter
LGKVVGVFGAAWLAIRMGWAPMPRECTTGQLFATARLCGIGFTMSLFIAMLAFVDNPSHLIEAKLGILLGSVLAGVAGAGGFIRAHQG